jgi:hypothetical protein
MAGPAIYTFACAPPLGEHGGVMGSDLSFTTVLLAVPIALYQLVDRCSLATTSTSVSEVALR